jgi:bifunctional UDP-N-acetylglucosamine pyrophosphorylase/glucosamine-1-phosphate N-acetyltransferase
MLFWPYFFVVLGVSMTSRSLQAIVLAAGRSSRFNTEKSKLTYIICGREMIAYNTHLLNELKIPTTYVVGYQKEQIVPVIQKTFTGVVSFAEQIEQKGTGHALLCSKSHWSADNILVMNCDQPLITTELMESFINHHFESNADCSFITAFNSDPGLKGYGNVVKSESGIKIVETKKSGESLYNCFINAGIYLFKRAFVEGEISKLQIASESGELYITDLIERASNNGYRVETFNAPFDIIRGVNTLKELWTVEHIKRSALISSWMEKGVRFSTAQNVHIDLDVTIGAGTYIGAGVLLVKGTKIGTNCWIDAYSFISNAHIGDNVTVQPHSVVTDSSLLSQSTVGPFAHIRSNSIIGSRSTIGNFVEVNRSSIGNNTKAKHLSYLGDAQIGNQVNIGAGTITCNYDGVQKHATIIEDEASIGAVNALVAPITIGKNACTAAGSTLTESVPSQALAIARSRQITKLNYVKNLQAKRLLKLKQPTQSQPEP